MTETYDFAFGPDTPYARVFDLIIETAPGGGVIVDLGCGVGALASPLEAHGFTYIGADLDEGSVAVVREEGHEALVLNLTDGAMMKSELERVVAGRSVSAILALDVIEHMPDPTSFLDDLRQVSLSLGRPPLVVSVPNVSHFDVGAKLLHARWDVTETGLLDKTHLAFFTSASLTKAMERYGWVELRRADFPMEHSDQHFPSDHPAIGMGSHVARYLRQLRDEADDFGSVNQFVRAYSCGDVVPHEQEEPPRPGLSVIVRTQGSRQELLEESLLSLASQTSSDFEVLLMVHNPENGIVEGLRTLVGSYSPSFSRRVRISEVVGGDRARPLNAGLAIATGSMIAFLDDDDVVTSDWVRTFVDVASRHPGTIVRTVTADQKVHRTADAPGYVAESGAIVDKARIPFSLVRHLESNRTPICAFAVPREVLETYSITFDETLEVVEDWDFFLRCARRCGVRNVQRVTSIYRRWTDDEASWHSVDRRVWDTTRKRVLFNYDAHQLVLPPGSVTEISELIRNAHLSTVRAEDRSSSILDQKQEIRDLTKKLKASTRRVSQLENSTSWKVTAPLRAVMSVFKRDRK